MHLPPLASLRRLVAALVIALLLPSAAAADTLPVANPDPSKIAEWEPCLPDTGVTVMVSNDRLGDGKVHVRCALGDQESGVDALQHAGFTPEGTATYGLGFICRIDGLPTPAQEDCLTTPGGDSYWVYLKGRPGGRWGYSGLGAASPQNRPRINSVEGWAFQAMPVEPMDARGPSGFELPPAQARSAPALRSGLAWLTRTLRAQVASGDGDAFERVMTAVVALQRGDLSVADVEGARALFSGAGAYADGGLPGWTLPDKLAHLMLALQATGGDPTDDAGEDLRARLLGTVDPDTGGFTIPFGFPPTEDPATGGLVLEALARSGPLDDPAVADVLGMVVRTQEADGSLSPESSLHAEGLAGLAIARARGLTGAGLDEAISAAADWLESLQAADGGVRMRTDPDELYAPTVATTGAAALALALAGRQEAAERAARWVSRYQVTSADAGTEADAPGAPYVGAVMPNLDALRDAIVNGPAGPDEALAVTPAALAAFAVAGPYGPRELTVGPDTAWFDSRAVGAAAGRQTVRITNDDERPATLGAPVLSGAQAGDFSLDASDCAGRTLATGDRCDVVVSFAPGAAGGRQALASLPVAEVPGETVEIALGGTASPQVDDGGVGDDGGGGDGGGGGGGTPPGGGGTLPPGGGARPAPRPPAVRPTPRARIVVPGGVRPIGRDRRARLATVVCPSAGACRVRAPRRVVITLGRRRWALTLLVPARLRAGQRAALRVRVPRGAVAPLRRRRATVRVRLVVTSAGTTAARTLVVRIGSDGRGRR